MPVPSRRSARGRPRRGGWAVVGVAVLAVVGVPGVAHLLAAPVRVEAPASPAGAVPASLAAPATPAAAADPDAPTAMDRDAGILRRTVGDAGGGGFDVVPGSAAAPGPGEVRTIRVEVERGLPVDGERFAGFVLGTLNDPRGWGHGGTMSFARTDGDAPVTVVLASPETTAGLCDDDSTRGRLSCRNGPRVVLTFHRWVNGTAEYSGDLDGYRRYLVNHEVGHALGHGHALCPGPGAPAPVMQQQTLGLRGCTPNSWPYP